MAQYTGSVAWAYNDVVSYVQKGTTSRGVADALGVFNANWIKDAEGKPNLYLLEAYRGMVPFGIILARMAWDNPQFYINRRGIIGGRPAGGLAMQRVQDYQAFNLDPQVGQNSIALLIYKLREIAERRLDQYRKLWDTTIFGRCPQLTSRTIFTGPIAATGAIAEAYQLSRTHPRALDLQASWQEIERAAKEDYSFQYVGECIAGFPSQPFDILCGGQNPPPFWPLELASKPDFWRLVLLEERTSTELGNKIWEGILSPFGSNGYNLPSVVLALLGKKRRLFAPILDVHLTGLIYNRPQAISVSNFDIATIQAELRNATAISNGAGYIGISALRNSVGWTPGGSGNLKLEPGTIRKFRTPTGTVVVPTNFPEWTPDSDDWAALSTGAHRVPAPTASLATGATVVPGETLIRAPRTPVKRSVPSWKKFIIALSVGSAGLLGLYYYTSRKRRGKP